MSVLWKTEATAVLVATAQTLRGATFVSASLATLEMDLHAMVRVSVDLCFCI